MDQLYAKHKELCQDLNIDTATIERSWQSYKSISYNYQLEGAQKHWLCCSIFIACRKSVTPTVDRRVLEGNCVSLTQLLRICKISIYEFFTKIKMWMEMASTPKVFRDKVEKLECSFAVSVLIYRKYRPMFEEVFAVPNAGERSKGKKAKPTPCSSRKLFEFGWVLFVCAKGEYPEQSDDLVTSFHLLLCVVDLLFVNSIADRRRDLINPKFKAVPADWASPSFDPAPIIPSLCIIQELCEMNEGNSVDASVTREYTLKPVLKKFFEDGVLLGDANNFLGLLKPNNFDQNIKGLKQLYERYVLSCGEVDARIFINHSESGSKTIGERPAEQVEQESINALVPATPLTGRSYLHGRSQNSPLAAAQSNVNKLRAVFATFNGQPSPKLRNLMASCGQDTSEEIECRLANLERTFNRHFQADRFKLVTALYYHLLENILLDERIKRPSLDLKPLFKEPLFHTTLALCCIEIVTYSYDPQRRFPFVLNCFSMAPFEFYRIIEIVVKNHQDSLTRDIIKHLNTIEEQTLESFAWEKNSPLWDRIAEWEGMLPTCQDADRSRMTIEPEIAGITPHNPGFIKAVGSDDKFAARFEQSPNSGVKKQLFQEATAASAEAATPGESSSKAKAGREASPNQRCENKEPPSTSAAATSTTSLLASAKKSTRAGSLGLFFRKFYKLAFVRLVTLCHDLELMDEELRRKIWTTFEHSITEQTELLRDRHLDQLIMCAIYVIFRVTGSKEKTFTEIMRCYRSQPQAASHIYRSVFLEYREVAAAMATTAGDGTAAPPTPNPATTGRVPAEPGDLAGISTRYENEERGDIIRFYNTIYVQKMQAFALKFSEKEQKESLLLSPLPHVPNHMMSPRKVSEHHKLYIQPLDRNILHSPNSITYSFPRSPIKDSPAKNLMEINRLVNQERATKRILVDEENGTVATYGAAKSKIPRKLESLISDRQGQNRD